MTRYKEYQPNERIVDRAVALWMTMLSRPKYDNLGANSPESPDSILSNTMAAVLAAASPKNNTPEVLQRFGEQLRKILLAPLEWGYTDPHTKETKTHSNLFSRLEVDYHPNAPLRTAAERAGLKMEFPWKTFMQLTPEHLYLGYGYGATYVYHYPLSGERWLVTTLCGEDIAKIIALVEAGVLTPELTAP